MRDRPLTVVSLAMMLAYNVGCVGDAPTTSAQGDASTNAEASASCVPIPIAPGVDCFSGGRCTPENQQCCTGLTGNGLIGQCAAINSACSVPYLEQWTCDKGFDCPANAPKCCTGNEAASTLFASLNSGQGCPLKLHVDAGGGGGGPDAMPPSFSIATCQTSCSGFQLCSSDQECAAGLKCFPTEFEQQQFSKTFGVCLP